MRLYLEASEMVDEEAEAEFIRADITDMTDKEKEDILSAIKDIMAGKKYRFTEHICGHDNHSGCKTREI